ncbi:hypothetical protein GCM10010339_91970 [Streptomyces alanosinicus]|uniref:Ketosynthase family 3 (KS3) domain-containing protein n=1 Tax=Streptomyces alanosinicus TaxID=68171 RepID=A0A918YTM4_9ACTN|nr:hypothetical protein GCM10010339_91970 [Streptomyces alanosinicus]
MAAAQLAIQFKATGPNLTLSTACAAGANAIGTGTGRMLLAAGAADIVLAGGTEATLTPYFLTAFARMGALSRSSTPESASRPFDAARDGFVMGEGAGVLVLETERHAQARGALVHAHLAGYAANADGFHVTAPDPSGAGIRQAMRHALADADVVREDIGHINAHGTSTPLNDTIESKAISRIFTHDPPVTSTKGVTGHTLGASGAIEAVYTVLALQHGVIPPTANLTTLDPECPVDVVHGRPRRTRVEAALSNSFGFGGQNAVLVFVRNGPP